MPDTFLVDFVFGSIIGIILILIQAPCDSSTSLGTIKSSPCVPREQHLSCRPITFMNLISFIYLYPSDDRVLS